MITIRHQKMDSKIEEAESYTTHKQLLPSTEESSPCTDTATPEQQKNVSSSCMTELEGDLFDAPESSILIRKSSIPARSVSHATMSYKHV